MKCNTLEGFPVSSREFLDPKKNPGCGGCYPPVYLDDMVLYNGDEGGVVPDLSTFAPHQLEAVEYYKSAAQTPLKYSRLNSQCGVLVLHSRRTFGGTKQPD